MSDKHLIPSYAYYYRGKLPTPHGAGGRAPEGRWPPPLVGSRHGVPRSAPNASRWARRAVPRTLCWWMHHCVVFVPLTPTTSTSYYLSVFTMILLLAHPPMLYQFLCIFLSTSLVRSLLGLVNPNDRFFTRMYVGVLCAVCVCVYVLGENEA